MHEVRMVGFWLHSIFCIFINRDKVSIIRIENDCCISRARKKVINPWESFNIFFALFVLPIFASQLSSLKKLWTFKSPPSHHFLCGIKTADLKHAKWAHFDHLDSQSVHWIRFTLPTHAAGCVIMCFTGPPPFHTRSILSLFYFDVYM